MRDLCACAAWWREDDRSRLITSTGARYTVVAVHPSRLLAWWWRLTGREVVTLRYLYLPGCPNYYAPHGAPRERRVPRSRPWSRTCGRCLRTIRRGERWTHEGPVAVHRACLTGATQPAQEGA